MIDRSLLAQLSAEHFTSGEHLAERAGCSRAAIAKKVEQLRAAGILVEARPRVGYRLAYDYAWWEQVNVDAMLPAGGLVAHVLAEAGSTNEWLRDYLARQPCGVSALAITDFQREGKGRRGRSWLAPPGRQMTFSIGACVEQGPLAWIGVALAVGVEVAEGLRAAGWPVQLKWPNDILLDGAKLAGILVEMDAMAEGPSRVVVGIGINEYLLPAEREALDRPVAALRDGEHRHDRRALLGNLLARLTEVLRDFPEQGLSRWLSRWQALDALQGRHVDFQRGEVWMSGKVLGVDAQGCLLLDTGSEVLQCHSGEVSVRKVEA